MGGLKRMAAKLAAVWEIALRATKAFFEIGDRDTVVSSSKKVSITAARRVVYLFADYWIALFCAGLVGTMKYWDRPFYEIFLATWGYDFVIATAIMVASEKSGHDFTLGKSFRRAADVIRSSHKIAGYLAFIFLNAKAIIWDGPEQVVIFFKKEIGNVSKMVLWLLTLTSIQGLFWALIYSLGYDSISELINLF